MSSVTLPSIDCCEPFFNKSASAQKNAAEEKKKPWLEVTKANGHLKMQNIQMFYTSFERSEESSQTLTRPHPREKLKGRSLYLPGLRGKKNKKEEEPQQKQSLMKPWRQVR